MLIEITSLPPDNKYHPLSPSLSARSFPLNHGRNPSGTYTSTAFLIRHDPSAKEFLFFGDLEPDTLAPTPRTIDVWRAVAPKIPSTLSTLFIECSWPLARPIHALYGHLGPEHLVDELEALAREVVLARRSTSRPVRKRRKPNPEGALSGVRVVVMHCKEAMAGVILEQVRALVQQRRLGAEVVGATQGMSIEV